MEVSLTMYFRPIVFLWLILFFVCSNNPKTSQWGFRKMSTETICWHKLKFFIRENLFSRQVSAGKMWKLLQNLEFFPLMNSYWALFMRQALSWMLGIRKWMKQAISLLLRWEEKDRKQANGLINDRVISEGAKCCEENRGMVGGWQWGPAEASLPRRGDIWDLQVKGVYQSMHGLGWLQIRSVWRAYLETVDKIPHHTQGVCVCEQDEVSLMQNSTHFEFLWPTITSCYTSLIAFFPRPHSWAEPREEHSPRPNLTGLLCLSVLTCILWLEDPGVPWGPWAGLWGRGRVRWRCY